MNERKTLCKCKTFKNLYIDSESLLYYHRITCSKALDDDFYFMMSELFN